MRKELIKPTIGLILILIALIITVCVSATNIDIESARLIVTHRWQCIVSYILFAIGWLLMASSKPRC